MDPQTGYGVHAVALLFSQHRFAQRTIRCTIVDVEIRISILGRGQSFSLFHPLCFITQVQTPGRMLRQAGIELCNEALLVQA